MQRFVHVCGVAKILPANTLAIVSAADVLQKNQKDGWKLMVLPANGAEKAGLSCPTMGSLYKTFKGIRKHLIP